MILFLLMIYESDTAMIKIPLRLASSINAAYGIDISPQWLRISGALFRLEDDINPFRFKKNLFDGTLPIYNLKLSPSDLQHLDNVSAAAIMLGHMPDDQNTWRSAKLNIDGKDYNIKAKLHGDSTQHWSKELKSYQIKADKEYYIGNIRVFNLLIFEDRFFTVKIERFLSKLFGLQDVRDNIVVLRINGVMQGIYNLQEKIADEGFLEYNKCSNCFVVRLTDNWVQDHPYNVPPYYGSNDNGITFNGGHLTPFDYELANLDVTEPIPNAKGLVQYKISQLFNLINEGNPDVIKYFDIDELSSFEAARMILGNAHVVAGDNFHTIYKSTNGKLYPILDPENIYSLQLQHGGFEHYLNTYAKPVKLFYLLYQNDELRYLRNQKVYDFISNNTLMPYYASLLEKYEPYATSYKTNSYNSRYIKYRLEHDKEILQSNMAKIKKNLDYAKAYFNVIEKGNNIKIEAIPDSLAQLKFNKFKIHLNNSYSGKVEFTFTDYANKSIKQSLDIRGKTNEIDLVEFTKGLYFFAGLDENLYPQKRYYHFSISFPDADQILIGNIDIKMQNDVTKQEILPNDIYLQIANGNDYYDTYGIPEYFSFESFKKEYPGFKWHYDSEKNEITLLEGSYTLNKDMVVPITNRINIEEGTTIKIAENKSILSYSPINVMGTKEKPVIINALAKNKPFGTFAAVGDGKKELKSVIKWLDLSGGNEKWINGLYFSGQFAIYHMNVTIDHSSFHGSHSDDGINIKYSNVEISNSKFYGNNADQIDLDFVMGIVKNSDFNGYGDGDSNGDGLDLSGSTILAKNNKFYDSPDKGISIGEGTKIMLFENQIYNNNLGIAVKDSSESYLIKNIFVGNKIAIDSYQKKPLFGGGISYLYKNEFKSNDKNAQTDQKSAINNLDLTSEAYGALANKLERGIIGFPAVQK